MPEILQNLLSKADLLIVFIGMAALLWRSLDSLSTLAHILASAPQPVRAPVAVLPAAPVPHPPAPLPTAPPPVIAAPKPAGAFADAPPWFTAALHEIGFHETGANQGLDRYIAMAHCGENGQPWCAIFANAMLESSGIPGSRSPSSQSFRTHPAFVQLSGPALGAIAVFWRISRASGQGHVGFYRGEDATRVWTLGGNENDMVQIEALPKDSDTFGLIGYWWPKGVPEPTTGAVLMPTGAPTSMTSPPAGMAGPAAAQSAPGVQTGITATVFGGPTSAYDGGKPISETVPGVALPARFEGVRPHVRVTNNANGKSVDCEICDVGPWNGITKERSDRYWETGTRPQAESGTDLNGRHTNKAGIDLNAPAAKAIGIEGKGLVSWSFIEAAQSASPIVT